MYVYKTSTTIDAEVEAMRKPVYTERSARSIFVDVQVPEGLCALVLNVVKAWRIRSLVPD